MITNQELEACQASSGVLSLASSLQTVGLPIPSLLILSSQSIHIFIWVILWSNDWIVQRMTDDNHEFSNFFYLLSVVDYELFDKITKRFVDQIA